MPYRTLEGHRIYLEWTRHGDIRPPVVFLHDGLGCTRAWKKLPERIGRDLKSPTLSYDRWGYGRSDERPGFPPNYLEQEVPFLEHLLDALEIGRIHLVGHSDGAVISLLFAAAHPDRVLSVVAEAPHTFVEKETREGLIEIVRQGPEKISWLAKFHPDRWSKLFREWSSRWLSDKHAAWDIRPCLSHIAAPILVVQGDADEFATLAQVTEIERLAVNVHTWVLADCGHAPHGEQPDEFRRRVAAHIRAVKATKFEKNLP